MQSHNSSCLIIPWHFTLAIEQSLRKILTCRFSCHVHTHCPNQMVIGQNSSDTRYTKVAVYCEMNHKRGNLTGFILSISHIMKLTFSKNNFTPPYQTEDSPNPTPSEKMVSRLWSSSCTLYGNFKRVQTSSKENRWKSGRCTIRSFADDGIHRAHLFVCLDGWAYVVEKKKKKKKIPLRCSRSCDPLKVVSSLATVFSGFPVNDL